MRIRSLRLLLCGILFLTPFVAFAQSTYQVFVGTYTGPHSKGIYSFRFDAASGKVTPPEVAAETENPSFLVIDASGRFVYAVNETGKYQEKASGAVSVFAIDGAKLILKQQVASMGADQIGRAHV